jgi:hypothetical protein
VSDLTDMWDELRRGGCDANKAVVEIAASTGIERATVVRQLGRSLLDLDRDADVELRNPLRSALRATRGRRQRRPRRTTLLPVPSRPAREGEAA